MRLALADALDLMGVQAVDLAAAPAYLGRTVRDISRQIASDAELDAVFKWPLYQASTVLEQRQRPEPAQVLLARFELLRVGVALIHDQRLFADPE
ncbi:hypothetical protein [Mesorhizobium sp. M1216]|uniref:hypothetical protein n=1 Tax=Mesorhizobium sp. M1216 TaxID=2957069 RepID=UPI003336C4C1